MAKKTGNELQGLSVGALQAKQIELQQEAFKLRFQHSTAQLENTSRIRQVRRDYARVQTLLVERARKEQGA
ncbi:MAG: 50S ribosomal protein L29 [Magnetococcus sp. DMHC-6]